MELKVYPALSNMSADQLSQAASDWCEKKITKISAKTLFLPAGQTPVELYRHWEKTMPAYLQKVQFLQIDEVIGTKLDSSIEKVVHTKMPNTYFKTFFLKNLPSFASQFKWIDKADQVADLGILGLGLNGHIAFHEPHLPNDFFSGCVRLSETTCTNLKIQKGSWGVSYGAGAFLKCKSLLMMVTGNKKKEVLAKLLKGDPSLPASLLLKHPDLTIIADDQAADLI